MVLKSYILVLSLIWAGMTFAQEQHKRLTLVIGNAAYQHGGAAGTFTDNRNNKSYKWLRIGNQVWMAENLDFSMAGSDVNKNGDRLYIWAAAMKACPTGWHLPSDEEWDILINRFGGAGKAGAALKSTSGWKDGSDGTNSSGFTGLPAGYRNDDGAFYSIGMYGSFWSSAEGGEGYAWYRYLGYGNSEVGRNNGNKDNAFSCRCVRD